MFMLFCSYIFENGPSSVLRCVRLSRPKPCESQFELRTSYDMQREWNDGMEYIQRNFGKDMHITVCLSATVHRL